MKGSVLTITLVGVAIIIILVMLGYIFFGNSLHPTSSISSNTVPSVAPPIPVKDFAPSLTMSQKTTILIELSDSSEEKYIVPTSQVATYVKSLPEGYHVVSKSP